MKDIIIKGIFNGMVLGSAYVMGILCERLPWWQTALLM